MPSGCDVTTLLITQLTAINANPINYIDKKLTDAKRTNPGILNSEHIFPILILK